jgi:hypothetical protein
MKVTGSCHCGAIAYEAEVDAERVVICHCTDCQKLTGSAYRVSVGTTRQQLVVRHGVPAIYVKTLDRGARRAQAFCSACGSPLFTYDVDHPEALGLRVGCIDQRRGLRPVKQIWCQSALPWSMDVHDLPRTARE